MHARSKVRKRVRGGKQKVARTSAHSHSLTTSDATTNIHENTQNHTQTHTHQVFKSPISLVKRQLNHTYTDTDGIDHFLLACFELR